MRFRRKLGGPDIPLVGQPIDFDGLQFGVDDPVFPSSIAFVEFALVDLVGLTGAGGEDLDDQVRRLDDPVAARVSSRRPSPMMILAGRARAL